jgi:nucleolar protein 56
VKIVPDNCTFARCVKLIKNRKELSEEKLNALEEIVMDSVKARAIVEASKSSMGMDISPLDLFNIEMFANRIIALADYRSDLKQCILRDLNPLPSFPKAMTTTYGTALSMCDTFFCWLRVLLERLGQEICQSSISKLMDVGSD